MSSSSKYAALPYIASGEQDLFETDDQPEVDHSSTLTVGDASVEIIPSGTVEAFQKFAAEDANKYIKNENFANESYENKFQRIKAELDELESSIKVEATAKVSTNDVSELINRLSNLQGSLLLGGDAAVPPEDVSIDVPSKNGSSMLQYELFCKPSLEEAKLMSKLNIIDQRINKIENLIGKRGSLFDDSIVSVVSQLRAKVAQLDQASLDKLIARLNVVLEKVKRISETKSALEVIEKESKLNELYEHYVRTNESREVLLNTFERLQVLSSVQEQDLAGLKSAQDEVQLSIDRNSKTLKGLQEDFRTKTEEIKHTIEDFHKRLEKLSK